MLGSLKRSGRGVLRRSERAFCALPCGPSTETPLQSHDPRQMIIALCDAGPSRQLLASFFAQDHTDANIRTGHKNWTCLTCPRSDEHPNRLTFLGWPGG